MKDYKVITKSKWNLNCKEATYLTELHQEGKLSVYLKLRLWYHLTICVSCREFKKQTLLIAEKLKSLGSIKKAPLFTLSNRDKHELKSILEKGINEKK